MTRTRQKRRLIATVLALTAAASVLVGCSATGLETSVQSGPTLAPELALGDGPARDGVAALSAVNEAQAAAHVVAYTHAVTQAEIRAYLEAVHAERVAAAKAAAERKARERAAVASRAPVAASGGGGSVWDRLAQCESGGNWSINTGNGYYGGLQFNLQTWRAYGGTGYPHEHSREGQIAVAERLRAARGFQPWPACSRKLGLR